MKLYIYISFFQLQLQCSPCTHNCVLRPSHMGIRFNAIPRDQLHIDFATASSAGTGGFLPGLPAGHLMTLETISLDAAGLFPT